MNPPALPIPGTCRATAEDESALLARARGGDAVAFDALCRQHGDRLFGQALGLCRERGAAEDLTQETLIAAWRGLERFDGACRFSTWLCGILLHRHRTWLRRRRFRAIVSRLGLGTEEDPDEEAAWARMADPRPEPGVETERDERALAVLRCLDRLPAAQRAVVFLRFYADEPLEAIASTLGCSLGTVKSRLHHGLDRLRRMKAIGEHLEP